MVNEDGDTSGNTMLDESDWLLVVLTGCRRRNRQCCLATVVDKPYCAAAWSSGLSVIDVQLPTPSVYWTDAEVDTDDDC